MPRHRLKITKIGNSLGIVLSKELLATLRISKDDNLFWHETPNGIELTPYNPQVEEQLELAEEIMRENRDVLKKLAK